MPEAACGGVKHVLAICGQDTKISKAAQQRDSLLLRFKTEDEVGLPMMSHLLSCALLKTPLGCAIGSER